MAAGQSLANASGVETFGEWCDKFSAYVTSHVSDKCTRVDVVFNRYLQILLKEEQEQSAKEVRERASGGMCKARNRGSATGVGTLP